MRCFTHVHSCYFITGHRTVDALRACGIDVVASFLSFFFLVVKSQLNRLGQKRLPRTDAHLLMMVDPLVEKTVQTFWTALNRRAIQSPTGKIPSLPRNVVPCLHGAPPLGYERHHITEVSVQAAPDKDAFQAMCPSEIQF